MRSLPLPCFVAFLLIGIAQAAAEATVPECRPDASPPPAEISASVGFIRCFVPPTEAYVLLRDGREVPLGWGVTVQGGDDIAIRPSALNLAAKPLLVLRFGETEIALNESQPRLQIPMPPQGPGAPRAALTSIMAFLSGFLPRPDEARPTVEFKTQDPDFSAVSFPLLEITRGQIVAGARNVQIPWIGGTPPFAFRVYAKTSDGPLVALAGLRIPRAAFTATRLELGRYHLVVTDAHGTAGASLIVRSPDDLPALPPDQAQALAEAPAPQELKRTLLASWLAHRQGGDWRLEAYQIIVGVPDDFSPAALLRARLEAGR